MSWLANILPGIKKKKGKPANAVPEGVWSKCPNCNAAIYSVELQKNLYVCANCDHHQRVDAQTRARMIFDDDPPPQSIGDEVRPVDFMNFKDGENTYAGKLKAARGDNPQKESLAAYHGAIGGRAVAAAIFDFSFMGGSMGSVAGERFTRAADYAAENGAAFVSFASSGGARMQEGVVSLVQMAKTTAALAHLAARRLPHISILCDPTTGGVAASFAMIGDIVVAEPKALIGFAGPRVIQETVREKLPEGFQRSEFLRERGTVDLIVDRRMLRETLITLLEMLNAPRR
ncbi:MAG: acetyl-CoA carboxylase, carboxyltransferase subunit beta [Gammaproteobacteria bacterium]